MRTTTRLAAITLTLLACASAPSAGRTDATTVVSTGATADGTPTAQPDGWISIFDGRTLDGWRASAENPGSFRVAGGELVANGPRAHLFYDGRALNHAFTDFEFRAEVLTRPRANSGLFIRTAYQPEGWPSQGYEVQVNNSHGDWRRTGSLYAVRDVREAGRDDRWFTLRVSVRGRRIRIAVDGREVVDYTEPDTAATRLTGTTIALQAHDPGSEVHYRNLSVRPLAP